MNKINTLALFFSLLSFWHLPLSAQEPRFDRSVEQILKEFFEGNSMKQMEEQVRKMMEEMESSFSKGSLNLFDDDTLNQLLRESGLFVELDHGQHQWLDSETERILVLKLETQINTPVDIKIENGQIRVQAKIEKEVVTETVSGQSRSVTIQQYGRVFLVPEDCEADSVKIENKEGEILIKFKKLASKVPKLQPLKKSEDDLTI
jgi:hypothetical protein